MGYYTYYYLDAYEDGAPITEKREKQIIESFSRLTYLLDYAGAAQNFKDIFCESMKWYDYNDNMIEVSKEFPTITFVLYGEGEERDDNWITIYRNGDEEELRGRIVYNDPVKDFAREVIWN